MCLHLYYNFTYKIYLFLLKKDITVLHIVSYTNYNTHFTSGMI